MLVTDLRQKGKRQMRIISKEQAAIIIDAVQNHDFETGPLTVKLETNKFVTVFPDGSVENNYGEEIAWFNFDAEI